jgi:hypothetical protein
VLLIINKRNFFAGKQFSSIFNISRQKIAIKIFKFHAVFMWLKLIKLISLGHTQDIEEDISDVFGWWPCLL